MRLPVAAGRTAVLAVLASLWLLAAAAPASAHPALVSSAPGAGYAVTEAPRAVTLSFNEPVTLPDRPLVVEGSDGAPVRLRVTTTQGGAGLVGTPETPLPAGAYEVTYRVVGTDGDLISGTFAFGVATPVGATGTSGRSDADRSEPVPVGTALLRGLLFLGVAVALGGGWLAWRVDRATGSLPGPQPLLRTGSVLALLAAVGLLAGLRGDGGLLAAAAQPGAGSLLGLQALLLVLTAVFARWPGRGAVAGLTLLLVVAVEGARAHPGEADGLLGAVLTVSHFLAGALWLGGLVHVLRVAAAWRGMPKAVRVAVSTYSRNALALFVAVSVSGTVSAVLLLPSWDDWTGTTYGRLLIAKIALFLLVVVLAASARSRLRRSGRLPAAGAASVRPSVAPPAVPSVSATATATASATATATAPALGVPVPAPRRPLGRAAAAETAALASVVLAAALVTTVTPARLVPASALLAAPVGPAVRIAERSGQVTVSVVASQGRVELRADAPVDGRAPRVGLVGTVQGPIGDPRPLDLERCGQVCWTGAVEWADGTNVLALQIDAARYDAGPVDVEVPWPAVPAPGLLRRVQEAMGARTAIDTVETVTSGFGVVVPHRSRRTGQEFLAGQPWAEGGAADATVATQDGGRTLLFALPALGYHFALRLDAADRIVSERIVTPNHLLTREYRYP